MITQKDLENCTSLVREANDCLERIRRTRSMLEYVAPRHSLAPGGPGPEQDRMAAGVAELDALEEKAREKVLAYTFSLGQVEAAIGELPNGDQRNILRMRYLDGLPWADIEEATHFHVRWCKELHSRGLRALVQDEEGTDA